MGLVNNTLNVRFVSRKNFLLIATFNYLFKNEQEIPKELIANGIVKDCKEGHYVSIPSGFYTDFGSIPQVFQSLISPIGGPTQAYVLHDYLLYCYEVGEISKRVICDKAFKVALKNEGVGILRRNFMYLCVRAYSILKEWIKK
ncbi:DUF1353 domain-containing protein [Helicobacter sp. CaF467b]|uniref:DUF1353 domain-containing protein n=1 Tax=Helicobacter sp. CaF467b TaxID=2919923 RepID=UPI001F5A3C25|nr:DUF1353 domain-containing protein [Helicobacter sp. CaF467b]MCI2236220.1 DUF1353 domain-containing protein [Helicobacter sp. CaF467b]